MKYDVIIIGAGPAGLCAGIYCARYGIKALIISKTSGGLAATAHKICNFPSYEDIKGYELMQKITKQAKILGVEIVYDEVLKIEKKQDFNVKCASKKYSGKNIIYAAGTDRLRLHVAGEGKFLGRGVSYCTTCDAAFFKNKEVCVVGGGDAALSSALLLAENSSKVFIIYRKENFRAQKAWIDLVKKNSKIKTIFNEEISEINGKEKVEEIKLKSGKLMKIDGVFIETGSVPKTEILKELGVKLSSKGYVVTDKNQKTNINGIFAAGDVTDNPLKQIITALSEGAVAAYSCYNNLLRE